jgi:TetR/AcrR family transcriptional regulator
MVSHGLDDTKASLLAAATRVFSEQGFAGARVDEIARRARANKAMIYYHFRTKAGLYQAVLLDVFSHAREELDRIALEQPDPAKRLVRLYAALAQMFASHPAMPTVMLREVLAEGRYLDPEVARAMARVFQVVFEAIGAGQASGQFRAASPLLVHINIMGTLLLYFAGSAFRGRMLAVLGPQLVDPTPDELRAYLIELLTRTLAASSATSSNEQESK